MDDHTSLPLLFLTIDPFETALSWNVSFSGIQNLVDFGTNAKKLTHHSFNLVPSAQCATQKMKNESGYTLQQAQVVLRHGARTPIWTIPNISEVKYDKRIFRAPLAHCDYDYVLKHITGCNVDIDSFNESPVNKRYERKLEGGINVGQLTTLGKHQCYERGLELRRRYVNQYKLIKPELDDSVYMRSTYILRTIESLQALIAGIYGADHLNKNTPTFHIAYHHEESLYPNVFSCPCLQEISSHGSKQMHSNPSPSRKSLVEECTKCLQYTGSRSLSFIALRDDLVARDAHGLSIPPQLEHLADLIHKQASIDLAENLGVPEQRKVGLVLALGRFHHMITDNMDKSCKDVVVPKLLIYSSHDSMIMPLLVALGNYEWEWPPYASYLAYELWRKDESGDRFVKILYNGQELKLPGKEQTMIPVGEFKEFLSPFTVTSKEWKILCEQPSHSIESPDIEYSIHYEEKTYDDDTDQDVPAGM